MECSGYCGKKTYIFNNLFILHANKILQHCLLWDICTFSWDWTICDNIFSTLLEIPLKHILWMHPQLLLPKIVVHATYSLNYLNKKNLLDVLMKSDPTALVGLPYLFEDFPQTLKLLLAHDQFFQKIVFKQWHCVCWVFVCTNLPEHYVEHLSKLCRN